MKISQGEEPGPRGVTCHCGAHPLMNHMTRI